MKVIKKISEYTSNPFNIVLFIFGGICVYLALIEIVYFLGKTIGNLGLG